MRRREAWRGGREWALRARFWYQRWRTKPVGHGFVNEDQAHGLVSQFWEQVFLRVQVVADLPLRPYFARTAAMGDRDNNRIFMDI